MVAAHISSLNNEIGINNIVAANKNDHIKHQAIIRALLFRVDVYWMDLVKI